MSELGFHTLLVPFGTAGDVHPFIGLGIELRRRGHRVTLIVNPYFERLALDNGFGFAPVGSKEEFEQLLCDPSLWHPLRGSRILAQHVTAYMPLQMEAIENLHDPGRTVAIASGGSFGARVAQEKLRMPLVTVALQPALFRSYHHLPVLAGVPRIPDGLPRFLKSLVFRVFDFVADRALSASTINAYRAEHGLPPTRGFMKNWWVSPDRVIGLFPEWYAPRQPDWPAQMKMTGFPLYDERRDGVSLAGELIEWLRNGDRPIVFTPGSAMIHGQAFFAAAAGACSALGRRGLFLTRYPQQIPSPLPAGIRHESYVPFSQLLHHAAALVYHGGIGTMSQAMVAGIPHFIMPMAHDQPDNAYRIQQLGIGDSLPPRLFRAAALAEKLGRLLASAEVAANCRRVAARFVGVDFISDSCDLIEEIARRKGIADRLSTGSSSVMTADLSG